MQAPSHTYCNRRCNLQPPQDKTPVILLTNDVANRSAAVAEGLRAMGVMSYCRTLRQDARELQVGAGAGLALWGLYGRPWASCRTAVMCKWVGGRSLE